MRYATPLPDHTTELRIQARLRFKAKRSNSLYSALQKKLISHPTSGMTYEEFAKAHVAELTKGIV